MFEWKLQRNVNFAKKFTFLIINVLYTNSPKFVGDIYILSPYNVVSSNLYPCLWQSVRILRENLIILSSVWTEKFDYSKILIGHHLQFLLTQSIIITSFVHCLYTFNKKINYILYKIYIFIHLKLKKIKTNNKQKYNNRHKRTFIIITLCKSLNWQFYFLFQLFFSMAKPSAYLKTFILKCHF